LEEGFIGMGKFSNAVLKSWTLRTLVTTVKKTQYWHPVPVAMEQSRISIGRHIIKRLAVVFLTLMGSCLVGPPVLAEFPALISRRDLFDELERAQARISLQQEWKIIEVERPLAPETASQLDMRYTDDDLKAAVNQLFQSVNPSLPENQYFTRFMKDKILWIITQQKLGKLRLILLKNVEQAGLVAEDLMASGIVEGKPMIVISQPSFLAFLLEGGRKSAPFTQQQKNDFAIGLVHEVVHLQNPNRGNPARIEDRLPEELRTWREVDLNVVRQFRKINQPMNRRLIEADDILRSCGDQARCEPLAKILLPSERMRQK
jgi:hypothetical protein